MPNPPRIVLPGQRALTAGERLQLVELRLSEVMQNQAALHDSLQVLGTYMAALERAMERKGVCTPAELDSIAKEILEEENPPKGDTRICRECGCTTSEPCKTEAGAFGVCSWVEDDLCSVCNAKTKDEPKTETQNGDPK